MDFKFLQNPLTKKWVVSAPRRAKRPDIAKGIEPVCPFCPGRESEEAELYRVPPGDAKSPNWLIRVLPNKFPFAPIHEVIVHSPDHHKNFDELPLDQNILILKTYRLRYQTHENKGQVYIFHNHGEGGGESLPHPHTQVAVVPSDVKMDIPRLDPDASTVVSPKAAMLSEDSENPALPAERFENQNVGDSEALESQRVQSPKVSDGFEESTLTVETRSFYLFCPQTSQWPDEVWIAPKKRGRTFGEITDEEITDLATTISQLIKVLDLRHGHEFPYNFYIYPGGDWYLRLIPRQKSLGGFEVGTGVFVNTQDPNETIAFLKEHFEHPDEEKIKREHQASYSRHA